eukprot:gb/GFBE01000859.1/.p1 GENE.gb/GFBE01000859.1/~~gb/GFBE01000859.1/.p1  ORF type:complete len:203 (+),score=40.96 gb/GFBE01000859.1/:1-609(+)
MQVLNKVLRPLDLGAFHVGVEVHGWEWSFRDTAPLHKDPAVFSCQPRQCLGHSYAESIDMGNTKQTPDQVTQLLQVMYASWPGARYDILVSNCCHFCDEFCRYLGVGGIPSRLLNLASAGQTLAGSLNYLDRQRKALASMAMEVPQMKWLPSASIWEAGCCRRISKAHPGEGVDDSEVADVVEQMPAAPASRATKKAFTIDL